MNRPSKNVFLRCSVTTKQDTNSECWPKLSSPLNKPANIAALGELTTIIIALNVLCKVVWRPRTAVACNIISQTTADFFSRDHSHGMPKPHASAIDSYMFVQFGSCLVSNNNSCQWNGSVVPAGDGGYKSDSSIWQTCRCKQRCL